MRKAEIDKAWESCRETSKKRLHVSELAVSTSTKNHTIPIASRVCALLGENGSGKSTFLESLANINSPIKFNDSRSRVDGLTATHNGTYQTFLNRLRDQNTNTKNESSILQIEKIDAASEVHQIQKYLSTQNNLDEYLTQFGKRKILGSELSQYQLVANRNYSSFSIAEIESPSDPDDVIPFFEVNINTSLGYDSRSMGFGEFCTCYLIWRIRRSEKGSVVLLDEPDSHLSSSSRRALTDFFAIVAAEKELWIVFTSHSIEPIERLREDELILLNRPEAMFGNPVVLAQQKRDAIVQLGFTLSRRFLLVVEDVDAQELVSQVLARWQPQVAKACEVAAMARGAEEIVKLINLFPRKTSVCALTAILDGDKKSTVQADSDILFLPGTTDPMNQMKEWCLKNATVIADRSGIDISTVGNAINRAASSNYHDFCSSFSEALQQPNFDTKVVRRTLLLAWLSDAIESAPFEEFAKSIKEKLQAAAFFS